MEEDFKVVLSYNAEQEKQESLSNFLNHLEGVNKVKKLSSQDIFDIFSKGAKGQSDYVLNPAFVPALYELQVNREVLLDTETWLQKNLYTFDEALEVYYKTGQNKTALYLQGFIKYIDILACLTLLALISFGFFVEAYYTQISNSKERIIGMCCGLLAGLISLIVRVILITYLALNLPLTTDYKSQIFIVLFTLVLGGTMSKWKRF